MINESYMYFFSLFGWLAGLVKQKRFIFIYAHRFSLRNNEFQPLLYVNEEQTKLRETNP